MYIVLCTLDGMNFMPLVDPENMYIKLYPTRDLAALSVGGMQANDWVSGHTNKQYVICAFSECFRLHATKGDDMTIQYSSVNELYNINRFNETKVDNINNSNF